MQEILKCENCYESIAIIGSLCQMCFALFESMEQAKIDFLQKREQSLFLDDIDEKVFSTEYIRSKKIEAPKTKIIQKGLKEQRINQLQKSKLQNQKLTDASFTKLQEIQSEPAQFFFDPSMFEEQGDKKVQIKKEDPVVDDEDETFGLAKLFCESQQSSKIYKMPIAKKVETIKKVSHKPAVVKKVVEPIKKAPVVPVPVVKKQTMEKCIYCTKELSSTVLIEHQTECNAKDKIEQGLNDENNRFTQLQKKVINYMYKKTEIEHPTAEEQMLNKIKKFGYNKEHIDNLQFYIENLAPLIVHIHVTKHMEFFIKDTHYRSQFETNKSSGSLSRPSRIQWEGRMFDKKYDTATDYERVKYGVLNVTNDPNGVKCCSSYGLSYFLMKTQVRKRCTFTNKDTCNADAVIGTFKNSFKVLSKFTDKEIEGMMKASLDNEVQSSCISTYKEVQIHGPIEFAKDIQRIFVNKKQVEGANVKFLPMVQQFSQKFKVPISYF